MSEVLDVALTILKIEIERLSVTSSKSFDVVVASLEAAIGHPDMVEFFEATRGARTLESVRGLHAGLQSLLSMRRIEARRKNARAFRLRFSQSLASLRHRLSQAKVRSTIQRLGKTTNPLA